MGRPFTFRLPFTMKFSLLAAAALLFTATAASAQISPSAPQRGGTLNQTTVPPQNPANPVTNPGTLDQRTPTSTNPTQTVPGTIDQRPTTSPIVTPGGIRRATRTTTPGTRNTTNGRRVRTVTSPSGTTPTTTTPAGTVRP